MTITQEETKICKTCQKELTLDWFHFRNDTNKLRDSCITCTKGYKMPLHLRKNEKLDLYAEGVKECCTCKRCLPLNYFNKDNNTNNLVKLSSSCKECYTKLRKTAKYKLQARNRVYKSKYGISIEDFNEKIKSQNNRCSICNVEFFGVKGAKAPNLDHCHSTGKVRDILCGSCNRALGLIKEDKERLNNMIIYINKWS